MAHDDIKADIGDVRLDLDLVRLRDWFARLLPELNSAELCAKQFNTGTSNPTYLIWPAGHESKRFVLRSKPPGKTLRGAHQIDREFRAQKALEGTGVPAARMIGFCEDEAVIGRQFYLMECVPGRVLGDNGASIDAAHRAQLWDSINDAIARLHSVDYRAVGLEGFGKTGNYAMRQLKTWHRQFLAADPVVQDALKRPELSANMEELVGFLEEAIPRLLQPEPTCLVHGDLGLHNLIVHSTLPQVSAILDWELCTLGHPLIDLDYLASTLPGGWRDDENMQVVRSGSGRDITSGLPSAGDFLRSYFLRRGLECPPVETLEVASLLNMFRLAAIVHGVFARGLSGVASSGSSKNAMMSQVYVLVVGKAAQVMRTLRNRSKL